MRTVLFCSLVLLTGCVSHEEASQKLQSDEAACAADKRIGVLRSESEYIACTNAAQQLYFQSNNLGWLRDPYQNDNIRQFMDQRLAVARDVDAKKLSPAQAGARYGQARAALEQRHEQYLREVEQREHARKNKLAERDRMAQSCIERYEASQPKKYDTRCYGGAVPDGGVVNGYANCETEERRSSAPRYIFDQCYNDASVAVGLPRF